MTLISRAESNIGDYLERRRTFNWKDAESHFTWAQTGQVNMAYECIDRHVQEGYGDKTALIYLPEHTEDEQDRLQTVSFTFADLKRETDRYATVLKKHGMQKGDRVFVFLPKTPECYFAILGAIKAGAIVGPLFEAFMEAAVKDRMQDCEARFLITDTDLQHRVPYAELPHLEKVFVLGPDDARLPHTYALNQALAEVEVNDEPIEWLDLEDGMIIHYTSGSTGKPKGVLHAHRAMIHHHITGKWVLDLKEDDIYWCTSHPGWVTGSSYGIFAPWLNRAPIVVNTGRFDAHEWYRTLEELKVTVWYSAPTAFRMIMSLGDEVAHRYNLHHLRHILSVGEPLNPEVVEWAQRVWQKRVHDTWWMTETGGLLIVNLPSEEIKPGSMGRAFPGIEVAILDEEGRALPAKHVGQLAVRKGWPGLMKTIWNNEEKYQSYFPYDEWYVSGDLAYKDNEGYVFFQGRGDDMINASGERIGPFEVESKLIEHPAVAEAGVIGKPDPTRGEIVKAFIVLREGYTHSESLLADIRHFVKTKLAAHAAPREIEVIKELPKTRISGKIMRRVLKAWELNEDPGDLTALQIEKKESE
ncbi:acetate--CoA ligase [Caldalkalibacillus salinus]|uniref:acetate--CoA ligase n=1 Tax=Caldalkalibacillus salinus TaxID=2803787 RepID=UPI001921E341|nr:acetate--CoA ligase [Caldalkalibacillus salinus]